MQLDPVTLKRAMKPTRTKIRRSPVAKVLKSANTPYVPKVEKVHKGEYAVCEACHGIGCYKCDNTGEVWR